VLDHGAFVLELVPDDVEGGVEAGVEVGPAEAGFADPGEVLEVLDDVLDAGQAVLGFGQQLEDVFVEEVEVLALLDRGEGREASGGMDSAAWCRRLG
jgi:orotate phosphoribosyltransferase